MQNTASLCLELDQLERRAQEMQRDLARLRAGAQALPRAQAQVIREEWQSVDRRGWILVTAGLVAFLLAAYVFYMNLGWYADQRVLPTSSDWLLDRLPAVQLIPLLSWGWLALHAWAVGVAALYEPRRMPFLLFLLGVYLTIRTLYVFLSPIGAPVHLLDMRELDALFAQVAGTWTFQNEFIFSGHTAVPFLFFLFFQRPLHRAVMLAGSIVMAVAVLLTHNHYSVDVLSAYLVGYAIFALSRELHGHLLAPLYRRARA